MKHGERVRAIRETQGISQEKFGNRLGVTKVAISNIENGNRSLTDQMIKGICREFNVNENWLRDEVGDMFMKIPESRQTEVLVASLLGSDRNRFYDIILEIIKGYQQLSPTSQQALNELADNILSNHQNILLKDRSIMPQTEDVTVGISNPSPASAEYPKQRTEFEKKFPPLDMSKDAI